MPAGSELWRKVVKYVSRKATAGLGKNPPAGTTPVEHLQLNVLVDSHESRAMGRWVLPTGETLREKMAYAEGAQHKGGQPIVLRH
jgi:hypothetical protein